MKKTLTINLAGYVFHIDEDAYNLLDNYVLNLRNYFRKESDADEIVHDMEQRISELFTEKLKESGREVISIEDVDEVINILGKPEQMNADAGSHSEASGNDADSVKKRFFRNVDNKVLGGVCSGIAAYFGWDVTLVRITVLLFGFFVHGTILAYIIAWIIIPPAKSATEKLSMQGKTINVENIGKTVTDGFERVKNQMDSDETKSSLHKFGEGVVTVAGFLIKFILILLAICCAPVIFALLIVFFVLIFVATGLVAATPAMITDLNIYMPMFNWATLGASPLSTMALSFAGILIIGIPIVGVIHMIMRYFGGWQPMSTVTKIVFIVLWFVAFGVGVFFALSTPFIGTGMPVIL